MTKARAPKALEAARTEFLDQWGAIGPAWGVSRIMSQIHALLMISPEPLNTDQIMEALQISRGSAHTNIKELCDWGLLMRVTHLGDRKEYFEAEKDVWRVIQCITRARKRKELEPVLTALDGCLARTKGLKDAQSRAFRAQLKELQRFARLGDDVMARVERGQASRILPWVLKFLR